METLATYTDETVWKEYQGIILDGVYVREIPKGIEVICDGLDELSSVIHYGKVIKQTGDTIYAIILIHTHDKNGIMSVTMDIDRFKNLYYPCFEIKNQFDSLYNKIIMNIKELIKDYESSY